MLWHRDEDGLPAFSFQELDVACGSNNTTTDLVVRALDSSLLHYERKHVPNCATRVAVDSDRGIWTINSRMFFHRSPDIKDVTRGD
jgi:hypothetical protein